MTNKSTNNLSHGFAKVSALSQHAALSRIPWCSFSITSEIKFDDPMFTKWPQSYPTFFTWLHSKLSWRLSSRSCPREPVNSNTFPKLRRKDEKIRCLWHRGSLHTGGNWCQDSGTPQNFRTSSGVSPGPVRNLIHLMLQTNEAHAHQSHTTQSWNLTGWLSCTCPPEKRRRQTLRKTTICDTLIKLVNRAT